MKLFFWSTVPAFFFLLLQACVIDTAVGQVRGKTRDLEEASADLTLEAQSDLQQLINGLATGDLLVDEGFDDGLRHLTVDNPFLNVTYTESCGHSRHFFFRKLICISRLCGESFSGAVKKACVLYGLVLPLIEGIFD